MRRFGEVLVKEPPCRCFSVKGDEDSEEEPLSLRIATDESELQLDPLDSCVWVEEECMDSGKGQVKFTYNFQGKFRTTVLAIRVLKVVPHRDLQEDSGECSLVCRVYLSLRDFRMLHTFNNSFTGSLRSLLVEVGSSKEFTDQRDSIKKKLEECSFAIFPDEEGFLLFKRHHEYTRPVHVLLRVDPNLMLMELCFPRSRPLLSTLSNERTPVNSLREAIDEFSQSPSGWPVVRKGEHGGDWSPRHPRISSVEPSEDHHTWNSDEDNATKRAEPFLSDTVRELHQLCSAEAQDCIRVETTNHEEVSIRSLVRQVMYLRLQEHFPFYLTIEKAIVTILGRFESMAGVFIDAVSKAIWKSGSESLCLYKLLAAAVSIPAVKRAVLKGSLVCLLLQQYELMTQILPNSTTSGSYNSQSNLSEARLEIGEMQCFTYPQLGGHHVTIEQATSIRLSASPTHPQSLDYAWTQTYQTPTAPYHVFRSARSETTSSTLSLDSVEAPQSNGNLTNASRSCSPLEAADQRLDVPKLSFYWLKKEEEKRSSANSGTTKTTMSLPDERSFVIGDERGERDLLSMPHGGQHAAQCLTPTHGNEGYERFLNSNIQSNSITRTLLSWGMRLEHIGERGHNHAVAYSIKCTILEILCAFSQLNMDERIYKGLENTKDYQLLLDNSRSLSTDCTAILDDDVQHPAMLTVIELLASPWQVFPGEQPPIRWGPSPRGAQLALAVLHEFACRPLQEVETSDNGTLNIRLFIPQDLMGESYHSLIGGVKGRLSQIAKSSCITKPYIEEATSLINLLCDFVASSPSVSQAPLVAYSCSDVFGTLESVVFCSIKVSNWRLQHFRAFHALLRLYRCVLERATDLVLVDFLISTLLERVPWVKRVRDFTRAVCFSEKLEKECDPEELACLRLGAWSYHTALVNVVALNQHLENSPETGYLPEDFQDSKPAAFGQNPLDFLSFLYAPESGLACQVLNKNNWTVVKSSMPLEGGLHAQVLLFLKTLFSVPPHEFLRNHEITAFYLNLHWTNFRRIYAELNIKREDSTAVAVCRLHLEVLRVMLKHHTLEIFAIVRKLGIMASLGDEIALEASLANQFNNFDPPPSQLTLEAIESQKLEKPASNAPTKSTETEALNSSGQCSFFSSSVAWLESCQAFNSVQDDVVSEEKTEASVDLNQTTKSLPPARLETKIEWRKMTRKSSRKKKISPRGTSESARKVISKTFSFRSSPKQSGSTAIGSGDLEVHCSFGSSPLFHFEDEPDTCRSILESPHVARIIPQSRIRLTRCTPSRIPRLRSRRSPRTHRKDGLTTSRSRTKGHGNLEGTRVSNGEKGDNSQHLLSSLSFKKSFPSFVRRKFSCTKIPQLPSQESSPTVTQSASMNSTPAEQEDAKKVNGLQAISNFFQKKKKAGGNRGSTVPSSERGQTSKTPSIKKPQKSKSEAASTQRRTTSNTNTGKRFFPRKKTAPDSKLNMSGSTKSRNASSKNGATTSSTKSVKPEVKDNQMSRTINRTARPVDGPSRVRIPNSPSHTRLNLSLGSGFGGRDSPLSFGANETPDPSRSILKSSNVPLLNLSGIKDGSRPSNASIHGQTNNDIANGALNTLHNRLGYGDELDTMSRESSFSSREGENGVSTVQSSKPSRNNQDAHKADHLTDGSGPPTFGVYCSSRNRVKDVPCIGLDTQETNSTPLQRKKTPPVPRIAIERITKTISTVETEASSNCFETPEFECTGNVAEDCKKVELLKRSYYETHSSIDSSEFSGLDRTLDEDSLERKMMDISHSKSRGESSKSGKSTARSKTPNLAKRCPSCLLESTKSVRKERIIDSQGSIKISILNSQTSILETRAYDWHDGCLGHSESEPPSPTSFPEDLLKVKVPTDKGLFESTTELRSESEHIDNIKRESQMPSVEEERRQLSLSPSLSSIESSDFDSMTDTSDDIVATGTENATIVPKLQFPTGPPIASQLTPNLLLSTSNMGHGNEKSIFSSQESAVSVPKVPALNLNIAPPSVSNVRNPTQELRHGSTTASRTHLSPADELSTFSWLHVSTKDSISESEFARLLNGGSRRCLTSTKEDLLQPNLMPDQDEEEELIPPSPTLVNHLNEGTCVCPAEALRQDRFVYSDRQLRLNFLEVLLEGMLLEYNTRAARDRDRCYADVEHITKAVPRILKHHLNHEISEPLIESLNERLLFQSKNLYRLLRLFCHSFFPVDLYKSVDHLGRGAFSHVHRCDLPFTDAPETCAVKVMDHPIGHNEMSSLMDVYSEIYILEQFKEDPNVCSLYDYGVNKDSVFMVMKDYKCSLLEWRKKFPEQCAGALKLFLRIFQDIVNAVKKLHDNNVVHFDLKCSNVLLEPLPGISEEHFWNPPSEEPPFRIVLADFGEARSYNNNWEAKTVRNRGTEYNKSPEMLLIAKAQQIDRPEYDRRKRIGAGPPSDVWALGCLLFELVTGEFLQLDPEWSRFFLRVTTNTMNVVDKEKQKMLPTKSRTVIGDLLDYILVRTHLWRPNLRMLSRKLETMMISDRIGPYAMPTNLDFLVTLQKRTVERMSGIDWMGNIRLPETKAIAFSKNIQIASIDCLLNPWFLSENGFSLLVCVKGGGGGCTELESLSRLHSTASRASIELLEICLDDDDRRLEKELVEVIVRKFQSRKACFTSESGFENKTMELVLGTLRHKETLGSLEGILQIWRQLRI